MLRKEDDSGGWAIVRQQPTVLGRINTCLKWAPPSSIHTTHDDMKASINNAWAHLYCFRLAPIWEGGRTHACRDWLAGTSAYTRNTRLVKILLARADDYRNLRGNYLAFKEIMNLSDFLNEHRQYFPSLFKS